MDQLGSHGGLALIQRRGRRQCVKRLASIIAAGSRRKRRETDDGPKSMFSLRRERLVSGHDASSVIALPHAIDRRRRCGCRGRGSPDGQRKVEAGLALQALALTGGFGLTAQSAATKMLAHYRHKVRANRRRLAKG
jgi:hypothetical protein